MVLFALLLAIAAIAVFLWGHRWQSLGGRHIAVGLALLTAAWIIQTVFVDAATVTTR